MTVFLIKKNVRLYICNKRVTVSIYHVLWSAWHSIIEDPVLAHNTLSWLPQYIQRAGGGINDLKMPHSSKGH